MSRSFRSHLGSVGIGGRGMCAKGCNGGESEAPALGEYRALSRVRLFATPVDYIVHGILQARILEWVAFPFSRGSSRPRDRTQVSKIAGGFFTS